MKFKANIVTLLILAALTGCKDEDGETIWSAEPVNANLAISVAQGSSKVTRMTTAAVQDGSVTSYRALQELRAFPFSITGNIVTINDQAQVFDANGTSATIYGNKTDDNSNGAPNSPAKFYYIEGCWFIEGINAFLAYALATPYTTTVGSETVKDKPRNGSLVANIPLRGNPSEISFTPDQIVNNNVVPTEGQTIATYLTAIANAQHNNATKWSQSTNSQLRAYYLNYIGQGNQSTMLIASSSANVLRHVGKLYTQISSLTGLNETEANIKSAILAAIETGYDATTDELKSNIPADYPASIGLPDGAATVLWTGNAFVPQTVTTTTANINSIDRFVYPAELWYYTNSRIKTSNKENTNKQASGEQYPVFWGTSTDWSAVLSNYEFDNGIISNRTTAVAIKKPLQYAVGRLEAKLNACDGATLTDANGTSIAIGNNVFPLTGIILGSQYQANFDFTPKTDTPVRFIYDAHPTGATNTLHIYTDDNSSSATANAAATANTLVLQTPDDEPVTVILEFQNNGDTPFKGVNGIIYPGTRFYLIGSIDPDALPDNAKTGTDIDNRAFTQDCTTTVSFKVESLAKAYNVLPDILGGRLEIGVQLISDWVLPRPMEVQLD